MKRLKSAWYKIEEYTTSLARNGRELYITAGGLGEITTSQVKSRLVPDETGVTQDTILTGTNGRVRIPEWTWKVFLVLNQPGLSIDDVTSSTPTYAYLTPNRVEPDEHQGLYGEFVNGAVEHPFNALGLEHRNPVETAAE